MNKIGEYLKNRRIELGIPLEEIEQHLKIRKKYLVAIEEGNENELPGKTYFLGYLRNYASYLEISQDKISQLLESSGGIVEDKDNNLEIKQNLSDQYTAKEQPSENVQKISDISRKNKYYSSSRKKHRTRKTNNINFLPLMKIIFILFVVFLIVFFAKQFIDRTKQPTLSLQPTEGTFTLEKNSDTNIANQNLKNETIQITENSTLAQNDTVLENVYPINELEPVPSYDPVVIEASEPAWIKILHNNQILFENYIFPDEDLLIKTEGTVDLLT
ncbi:MAG: helix-turn-helix domain-containing protein, partial [Atribacterota bacterium]|nr:helix-turn-helix domain-containing protein [Atribacterota bacterium]